MDEDIKLPESEGCKGNNYHNGVCPVKGPFDLLQQKLMMKLDDIHDDVKRLNSTIYGNGVPGIKDRTLSLENQQEATKRDINDIKVDIREIKDDNKKYKEKIDNWKYKVGMALGYLSAGGVGAGLIFKLFGGG